MDIVNAVGIDVSKGRSTVAILQPLGKVIKKPFDIKHTKTTVNNLIKQIKGLPGKTRIVMEYTGHYYEPVAHSLYNAGLYVSVVNPKLIKDYGNNSLRKVKTDKADAVKIARYSLDNWNELRQYSAMDESREELKALNRQFDYYTKLKTALKNNVISILDQTYPGVNRFFDTPVRQDGHQKWVDFAASFWHVDCVRGSSLSAFSERYSKWCKRNGYNNSDGTAERIYNASKEMIATLPKTPENKFLVESAIEVLNKVSATVEQIRDKMNDIASKLPEYSTVMDMCGVGPSLGPQLMAEIGDISRFHSRNAITAFAGVDPGKNDSGDHVSKSVHTSKRGSPQLRSTLFKIMEVLIKTQPDDPVYHFMDKKRSEGKPYYVYMTAGANKFLRIYYGKVKAYKAKQEANNS